MTTINQTTDHAIVLNSLESMRLDRNLAKRLPLGYSVIETNRDYGIINCELHYQGEVIEGDLNYCQTCQRMLVDTTYCEGCDDDMDC